MAHESPAGVQTRALTRNTPLFSSPLAALTLLLAFPAGSAFAEPADQIFVGDMDAGGIVVPDGYQRLTSGEIGFGVQGLYRPGITIDMTEWDEFVGRAKVGDLPPNFPLAFPGVSGSGPVIKQIGPGQVIIAHFHTPSSGRYVGSWAYQTNIGGPAIDVCISRTGGDFTGPANLCITNMLPDGQPNLRWWIGFDAPGGLEYDTDYYFNLKYHNPHTTHAGLFGIWYGDPL